MGRDITGVGAFTLSLGGVLATDLAAAAAAAAEVTIRHLDCTGWTPRFLGVEGDRLEAKRVGASARGYLGQLYAISGPACRGSGG